MAHTCRNVDNGVTGLQEIRIPRSDECGGVVGWQQSEHVDGESFVSVEMSIVGADGERRHLDSLRCCHSQCVAEHAKAYDVLVVFGLCYKNCSWIWQKIIN